MSKYRFSIKVIGKQAHMNKFHILTICQHALVAQTVLALRGSHGVALVPGISPILWPGSAAEPPGRARPPQLGLGSAWAGLVLGLGWATPG